jgi:hypothetical protein
MRFMMLVKASEESESGVKIFNEIARYNEQLAQAGVLLDLSELDPTASSARVKFAEGKASIVDGPFNDTKEHIVGYWLIQARSTEEAIEWAKRVPFRDGEIEVRRLLELTNDTV